MKIVIAPDKFKNSLNGFEFCDAVEEGLLKATPNLDVLRLPLADGGDGTTAIIHHYLKGNKKHIEVKDPLFNTITASYVYSKETKIAFIEMAEASGLKLLNPKDRNCMHTSSYGTGEMILDAIQNGAKEIILGIGGSATNDCGIGMATALGYRFLDVKGNEVLPIGKNLSAIAAIDTSNKLISLSDIRFKIACDVTNPLYGKQGAAYTFGAQKGASKKEIQFLNKGLESFSEVLKSYFKEDVQKIVGGGAAGGMGVGGKLFLQGSLISGIDLIMEISEFSKNIMGADW